MAVLDPVADLDAIQQQYNTVIAAVNHINGIIDGTVMADETAEVRQNNVNSGVVYLEKMLSRTYWTNHDMTCVAPAIQAGQNYVAS